MDSGFDKNGGGQLKPPHARGMDTREMLAHARRQREKRKLDDYYIVDEGHRLLTYVVLPTAHVTVLTRGLWHTVIPVSELAQILEGKNPQHRALFYPANGSASSAFTIRVGNKYPNPVVAVDQAYQP